MSQNIKTQEIEALAQLSKGSTARVVRVDGDDDVSRRLLEMGVVPGVKVRVVKTALFGCPMEIRVRNSYLALRRNEANTILVNRESKS